LGEMSGSAIDQEQEGLVAAEGLDEELVSGLLATDQPAPSRWSSRALATRVSASVALFALAFIAIYATAVPERRLLPWSSDCAGKTCPVDGEPMVYNSAAYACVCQTCAGDSFAQVQLLCRRRCFSGDSNCAQCFPDDAEVSVELRGGAVVARAMSMVRVGDRVLTDMGFSKVYAFMDHLEGTEAEYVQVSTEPGLSLALTAEHLVYAHEDRRAVLAGSLGEGDVVWAARSPNGTGDVSPARVANIARTSKRGRHAPLTEHGTIVVNGILASSYAHIQTLRWGEFQIMSAHDLGKYMHEPLRLACGFEPDLCSTKWHTAAGRHLWTQFILDHFGWLQAMNEHHSDLRAALLERPSAYSCLAVASQVAAASLLSLTFGFGSNFWVFGIALGVKKIVGRQCVAK